MRNTINYCLHRRMAAVACNEFRSLIPLYAYTLFLFILSRPGKSLRRFPPLKHTGIAAVPIYIFSGGYINETLHRFHVEGERGTYNV